jgi:hypothetical protein
MEFMNTTFAYGNGPYSRILDLGISINDELEKRGLPRHSIIIPLVYGERQKKIMMEEHGDIIKTHQDEVLLDETQGKILDELLYKGGDYQKNLEYLLNNQPKLEEKLRDYLSGNLLLKRFDELEISVMGEAINFEISHNPRVATGYNQSFYTTIGYFSEILERAALLSLEGELEFDPNLLREVKTNIAVKLESDRNVHFMPEPFTFSYLERRLRWEHEIFTPPFIHPPEKNSEQVEQGIYVMVSGIDGLSHLYENAQQFGFKLYCPPFIKNMKNANNTHTPDFVANPNIKYQLARTGWSSVWWSHMTNTPLITPAYTHGDDPEIFFNELTVRRLNLATIPDEVSNPRHLLAMADHKRHHVKKLNEKLQTNYGTLDGINYTARIIADSIEGKPIDRYRQKEPCLTKQ